MVENRRVEHRPGHIVDRNNPFSFLFDKKRVAAYSGDSIGSALAAAGIQTLSRSFKYHRPRGLMCVAGRCPNCLVTVNGSPNVRACTTPVREGMVVESQNAWPSLDFDAMSLLDRLDSLLPVGFYYKAFHRPKIIWNMVRPLLRKAGGLGRVNLRHIGGPGYHQRSRHIDILVVGGGRAGLSAALSASENGASVILVDDQPVLGAGYQASEITGLLTAIKDKESLEAWSGSTAFGFYSDNLVAVLREGEVVTVRADRVILATGAHDVPILFPGNDLPGVMLASGAIRLIRMYGVRPGSRVAIVTEDDSGYRAAFELIETGINIAAVLDLRPISEFSLDERKSATQNFKVKTGVRLLGTKGKASLEGIIFESENTELATLKCDLLLMSGRMQPALQLALQAGCQTKLDPRMGVLVPVEPPPNVYIAGHLTGVADGEAASEHGRIVGEAAAAGRPNPGEAALGTVVPTKAPTQITPTYGKKQFVCLCEDITSKDISKAVAEGFEDIQTLKRYSTVTMGPCQGKMCLRNFSSTAAACTGQSHADMGLTTMRPPSLAVSLGSLAGPGHMPVKRTSLHHKHLSIGARMVDSGGWQRPYSYGNASAEAKTVREKVGIIDVSTLGKLDVRGQDAGRLLDFLYTNRISNLRVGRVRYGVMCLDDGTILDDGTVSRMSDDRFFVTTTTGNVEMIEEWYKWWMATDGTINAQIANVTSGFAAINVAGPFARATLSRLTETNISSGGFKYMRSREAEVACIPSLLMRIGFVGETGWELHFPTQYSEHMWDALMEAGNDFEISPFGLEAQRILRLEKAHIIVNQDTDSLTTPVESGMEWAVRLNKNDFVGRAALRAAMRRGPRQKLAGLVMDRSSPVPKDGAPVIYDGSPVGRVTSIRMSPTADKPFGLAILPPELAKDGVRVHLPVGDDLWAATVRLDPIYDPDGKRLRE